MVCMRMVVLVLIWSVPQSRTLFPLVGFSAVNRGIDGGAFKLICFQIRPFNMVYICGVLCLVEIQAVLG